MRFNSISNKKTINLIFRINKLTSILNVNDKKYKIRMIFLSFN
jgi:hypothetical protein